MNKDNEGLHIIILISYMLFIMGIAPAIHHLLTIKKRLGTMDDKKLISEYEKISSKKDKYFGIWLISSIVVTNILFFLIVRITGNSALGTYVVVIVGTTGGGYITSLNFRCASMERELKRRKYNECTI